MDVMCRTRSERDWQLAKCSISARFKELLNLSLWTDCTFSVGEEDTKLIKCHRLVLAASSPVFEALFFGSLSNTNEVISVPDVKPHIFKLLLRYIYSDDLELKNVIDAGDLLYASKKYLLPQLTIVCLDYLVENTCLTSLWDIMYIAEGLNEECLKAACLKVMSRYHYSIWHSGGNHLSPDMLIRLLSLDQTSMMEVDFWNLLKSWAMDECALNNEVISASNLRLCLDRIGALTLIRFLAMSLAEFSKEVANSDILDTDECRTIESLIETVNGNPSVELKPILQGFSFNSGTRLKDKPVTWKCTRDLVRQDRLFICSTPTVTGITCSSKILVTGFEIVTKITNHDKRSMVWDVVRNFSRNYYKEHVELFVKVGDQVLSETNYEASVEFNSYQIVYLDNPVWFEPDYYYSVELKFPPGPYPLSYYAKTSLAKGTTFEFDDKKAFGASFINSILYFT